MPYLGAAGPRIPGRDSAASSAGLLYETGGYRATGSRDERGEMVTPTGGIIPTALVVWGQASHGEQVSHQTVDVRDEVPIGLGHPRDEVPDGLGHLIAVSDLAVAPRESGSRVREPVREENRPSDARALLPLSLGPVLPRFPDRSASAISAQIGHDVEDGRGMRAETTLQVGRKVEDEDHTGGRSGSGSGSRGKREYDVPQGGAALVRLEAPRLQVCWTIRATRVHLRSIQLAVVAPRRLATRLQREVRMLWQKMDCAEVC